MRAITFIVFITLISTAAYAYYDSGWNIISTTWGLMPFWTSDNPQMCEDLGQGEQHTYSWKVNASGVRGLYDAVILYNSSSSEVNSNSSFFGITIYDKGDDGVIPNESCTGCAFVLNGSNPFSHGYMGNSDGNSVLWNVRTDGPKDSEWDVFVDYMYGDYGEKLNSTTSDRPLKVRIVDYKWRDESGYINESWNCREKITISNSTGGSGLIEIREFTPDFENSGYYILNCSREIRVSEIQDDGTHEYIPFYSISDEKYSTTEHGFTYCEWAMLRFNSSLNPGESKSFFIYYNNPLAEIDSTEPSWNEVIYNNTHGLTEKTSLEHSWQGFYDSHILFRWNDQSDGQSITYMNNSRDAYQNLTYLNYNPQVLANYPPSYILDNIEDDYVFYFRDHGGASDTSNTNFFSPLSGYSITAETIENLEYEFSNMKLAMVLACDAGDNSTTMPQCSFDSWLSKSFIDKGADCYVALLGNNYYANECGESDLETQWANFFNGCFWQEIFEGKTILMAVDSCDNEHINAVIWENYNNACNQTLIR